MDSIESLIDPLRHSPLLPLALQRLEQHMAAERTRREQFYREITPEQKVEFIDGQVILHSPARNRHLEVTMLTATLLRTYTDLHQLGVVRVEKCLCAFPRNDYEPDIVFFAPAKVASLGRDTLKFPVPDLIVEVLSPTTEQNDRGIKFEDYAANAVGEYWIIDADSSSIEQYLLRDDRYELQLKSSTGILASQVISGFEVNMEALFHQEQNLAALRELLGGDAGARLD